MLRAIPVVRQQLNGHFRIQRAEERRRQLQAGDDNRLPAVHLRGEARVGVDGGVRRHVAALAEVFGQDALDELIYIEVGRKRHSPPLSERGGERQA